ncbi:hypothetical protein B0A50_02379 [Salinomyces thailandicus]|uniref:Uncharacterized protein n=1 Tax=Salinomyces thailandicus TaxID=706561 RepID=A0A4V5N7M9_9PEZI|nr:hypothetical protein B0A50_02379 [Salinomyces thailandica]
MPPSQEQQPQLSNPSISPRNSATPLLAQQQAVADGEADGAVEDIDPKTGKRRIFGLGSNKKDTQATPKSMDAQPGGMLPQTQAAVEAMKQPTELRPQPIPISPSRPPQSSAMAASPSRLRSSSPRLHSAASSEMIFERSVQEPVPMSTLHNESTDAHMPSHVITEDHIPPALEASAQAITSELLNPDEVEIVTSSAHQPAAASVLESSTSHADLTQLHSPALQLSRTEDSDVASSIHQSGIIPAGGEDEAASTYGQLDPNDLRRVSFISFADVVQHEHQLQMASQLGDAGSRDSLHIASLPSSLPSNAAERAGSPLRSPRSPGSMHSMSHGVITPPPGVNIDSVGEKSPVPSITGVGSPTSQHGELTIETMRQAVRKTASGDLSGVRNNAGMSPNSEETSLKEPRSRTNT